MKCQLQPFICKFCQVISSSFDSHQRHRRRHWKKYVPACAKTGGRLRKPVRRTCQAQAYHCLKQFDQASDLGDGEDFKSHPASDENSYQCHICQECFAGIALLEEHVRTHDVMESSSRSYQCEYCSKSFDESGEFLEHIRSHNSLRERYQCAYCQKSFAAMFTLDCHVAEIHCAELEEKEKLYPCNYCQKSFVQYSSRNRHVRLKHTVSRNNKQKLYQCNHCQKCFPDKTILRSHFRMHKIKKQSGKLLDQTKPHTSIVKTSNNTAKQDQCIHCKKSFYSRHTLTRHLQENSCAAKKKPDNSTKIATVTASTKANRFQCTLCQKSFTRKYTLEQHFQRHHCTAETLDIKSDNSTRTTKVTMSAKANQHQCTHCQKTYTRRVNLKIHLERQTCITNKKDTLYQCQNCEKSFKQRILLNRHMRRCTCMKKNAGERKMPPYRCQYCQKVFRQSSSHNRHVRLMHTGTKKYNKPYKCKICSNSFSSNFTLNEHLRVHTEGEVSQYQCKFCQKTFTCTRFGSLSRHLREKHAVNTSIIEQKPYQCRHCQKCFADSSVWRRHVRLHNLENQPEDQSKPQTSKVATMSSLEAKQRQWQCIHCKKSFSCHFSPYQHLQGNNCTAQKKDALEHIQSINSTRTSIVAAPATANQHQCRHCQKSFTGRYPLDQHLKRNDCTTQEKESLDIRSYNFTRTTTVTMTAKANQHQCTHCQKTYTRRHTLEQHLIGQKCAVKKKIPYQCKHCLKTFTHSFIYNQHIKTHTSITEKKVPGVLYECKYCEKSFTQPGSRSRLITLYHLTKKEQKLHQCKHCQKSFADSTTFNEHVGRCKTEELNKCGYSSERFVHSKELSSHITATHKKDVIEEESHKCVHCHKTFLQRNSLIQHLRTKVCLKELSSHITATHTHKKDVVKDKSHKCVHCHETFRQRDSLIQHLRTKVCVKNLTEISVSKDHAKQHTGSSKLEKSYNHGQIVEPRKSRDDTEHIESNPFVGTSSATATQVKLFQFKCDICDKNFALKGSLTRHVTTHHSSNQCQQCQKSFANLNLLKQHMETQCTKKLHQCWQCQESFSNRFVLNMHVKTHSDVQEESKYPRGKYQCGYCLECFDHVTGLGEHMKSHTSMDFVP